MTLIDDTFDCCGRTFDPMGDPLLYRRPDHGEYAVFCAYCQRTESLIDLRQAISDVLKEWPEHNRVDQHETALNLLMDTIQPWLKTIP